jgi:iron(III) transport system permease protein
VAGSRDRLVVAAALLAVVALVGVPLYRLAQTASEGGTGSISRVLHAPGFAGAAWHSLMLALVVPVIAVPLGAATALLLRRPDVPARRLLQVLVLAPLVVPQFVLGYSWTQAYSQAGFTDQLLGVHWAGLTGPVGVVVVLVVDAAPLSYLLTTAGLATRAQPDLERAARASGADGWTTLRTVTLPLLRPVLAAATVLTFVATLETFAVPQVLGAPGGFSTLTTRIYADLSLASDPASFVDAVTLALGLVVVAAVILAPADLVLGPRLRTTRSAQAGGAVRASRRDRRTIGAAALLAGYLLLAVGVPTLALVLASITRAVGVPATPGNWTLDNFRTALDGPTVDSIGHSLQLAVAAACALTLLGAVLAALERRRAGRALGSLVILTFAIPGSTLAVGLLIAYGRWLSGGLFLILLAYLAKLWALAHRTVSGAVDRVPPAEAQAARCSGAGPAAVLRTVWLPALAPALVVAWLLTFVTALHEVTMSSLLYSTGNETLAVAVLNSQQLGEVGTTAALSVVLTLLLVVGALPAWVLLRLLSRRRVGAPRLIAARVAHAR